MHTTERHFILGYGSLINRQSRAATGETGFALPVKIKGYERHWSVVAGCLGMSSVTVIAGSHSSSNGVLVEVPESELALFDEREVGYQRSQVPIQQLETYDDDVLPDGTIWIYHTDTVTPPSLDCPIVMSYADVILAGCLEYGDAFATDFVELTQGWRAGVVNDRQAPRYPRVQPQLDVMQINPWLKQAVKLSPDELVQTYTQDCAQLYT